MKRLLSLFLCTLLAFSVLGTVTAFAENEIFYDGAWHTYEGNFFKLKVNDKELKCAVPPIVFNDYSVVPARDVFESLGAVVSWRAEDQRVKISYKGTTILLYINERVSFKDGRSELMPIAPKIINEKTMIPARYVAESLGFDVSFDSKTDTISIKTKTVEEKPPVETNDTYSATLNSYRYQEKNGLFQATFSLSKSGASYSAFSLKEPDRLAVDLKGVTMASTIRNATPEETFVTGIRFGVQTDGLRVVFDLTEAQNYNVSVSGKTLTVLIGKDAKNQEIKEEEDEKQEEIEEIQIKPSRSITIDPGHGGTDPGAVYEEKPEVEEGETESEEKGTLWRETDINLAISLKVRDILEKNGVRVVMTRTTEKDVVRKTRPELANKEQTALFLSIHTNSVEANDKANGIETWGNLETNKALSGVTDKSFAENVQNAVIKKTKASDRGIKSSSELTVIKYSLMPSVLIEVGFITNQTERENLFNDAYRTKIAEGIAEGVLKTFADMGV